MSHTFAALEAEWRSLSSAAGSIRAVRRWALVEPDLAFRTLDEVMVGRLGSAEAGRAILSGLARLAPSDQLAARTLLQALLPGIKRLARLLVSESTDTDADLVGLAWERIRTYPAHRAGSVASNVLLDVRKRHVANLRKERLERQLVVPVTDVASAEDVVIDGDDFCVRQLVDARDRGLISSCALRAIVRTRLDGDSLEEAAAAEDLTVRNLVLRRWRGERALRRHLDPLGLAG